MTAPSPYFLPLNIGGTVYDLRHLDPVRFQVPSEKLRRAVTIRCRFTNHVFTRTFDSEVDTAGTPVVMDASRPRIFCPDRYRLSVHLPGAIVGLCAPRIYVRETNSRRNWLYVATVELPPATDGGAAIPSAAVRYQLFFTLRKAAKSAADREDVEMVVESAYAEDAARPTRLLGRALFVGLATAAVEGRHVHAQRPRRSSRKS